MAHQDPNPDLSAARKSIAQRMTTGQVHFSAPFIKRPVATFL